MQELQVLVRNISSMNISRIGPTHNNLNSLLELPSIGRASVNTVTYVHGTEESRSKI